MANHRDRCCAEESIEGTGVRLPDSIAVRDLVPIHHLFFAAKRDVAIPLYPFARRDAALDPSTTDIHGRVGFGSAAGATDDGTLTRREGRLRIAPKDALPGIALCLGEAER